MFFFKDTRIFLFELLYNKDSYYKKILSLDSKTLKLFQGYITVQI